jgi:hypothetical protein
MAIFRDYYLNDRQYERMINLLNSLNVDSVGFEHAETVDEIKGLFIEQMNDHKSIGDTNYADIARCLRIALNDWMESRNYSMAETDEMEDTINREMDKFLNRRVEMKEKYPSDDT